MPSQTLSRIDWRKLSAIDVKTFESELRSNRWPISEIGPMIAYSFIDSEFDLHSVDTNLVKLFKLSQILIAFLLDKYYNQYENLKDQVDSVKDIVEENRKLRKLLDVYKNAFTFGGTFRRSIGDNDSDKSSELFQCPDCSKAFGNSMYLQSHIYRRHPENSILSKGLFPLTQRINQYQSALIPSNMAVDDVKKELHNLKDQLKKTEEQLAEEKESRIALQDRLDLELEAKIKQLTSLLNKNKNSEIVHLIMNQEQGSNLHGPTIEGSYIQKITDFDQDDENEDKHLASKTIPTNLDEPQDLTGLLLAHTKEVRNLGNQLEKLVDKLSNESDHKSENTAQKSCTNSTDENDSVNGNDKSRPKAAMKPQSIINESKSIEIETTNDIDSDAEYLDSNNDESEYQRNQGDEILSYLGRYMEALGIQDKSNIGNGEFVEAMKVIKERRRRNGFQEKVNTLKDALDYEIRARKIEQRLELLNENSAQKPLPSISSKSPWMVAKNGLEETSSKQYHKQQPQEKQNRVRFGGITVQELDKSRKLVITREKAIKRLQIKPKSVLIRRDAQGNRIDTSREKPKRRISFSETRIEISPEYSSDDDDFDQMMSGEISTSSFELADDDDDNNDLGDAVKRGNSPSMITKESDIAPDRSSTLRSHQKNVESHDPIPPPTKPRHSKAFTLDDHLSTADLKWFDSDGSEDEFNHDNQKILQPLTPESSLKDNLESTDNHTKSIEKNQITTTTNQDDQRISVNELTKIIEEQLTNRQMNSKSNLTNSVDAVTGIVKQSTTTNNNNSYGVKAIGTLNYDSESD